MPYCQHAPRLLIESSLSSRFLMGNSEAMQYSLSHRCLLNGIPEPQTTKISHLDHVEMQREHPFDLTSEFCHLASICPTIDSLLLCIRSHACSDPKIIGSDQKQHLSGLLFGLSEKVKAVVFQFSLECGFTGAFWMHRYNFMRATAKSISLCQNRSSLDVNWAKGARNEAALNAWSP